MLQVFTTKRPLVISGYLFLGIIILVALVYGQSASSNFEEEPTKSPSEAVFIRNPNFIIETPVRFAWLPESINAYYLAGLTAGPKDFPSQNTIQKAITKRLTPHGFEYDKSAYSGKAVFDREKKGTEMKPSDLILVKNWAWAANFGASGLLREITLENKGSQDVRDLRIKVGYLGTAREKEGYWGPTSIFVIQDLLPANSEKTFKNINIGFRHPDGIRENMSVLSAKTITHDLLIGYYLVPVNAINDHDLNKTYNITEAGQENDINNEYKKGTLIIDVIDAETRVLVWRGAMQALPSFDSSDFMKQEKINLAVEKLIINFIRPTK
ncbi:MAG TPA: DUF4136 domain-containing protein [Thermodesulfobacteriota bacterium]|nr:DUF4136 domain-containing protein [Thermodesulfobacteriota bacterium]